MTSAEFAGLNGLHLKGSFGQYDVSVLTPHCAKKLLKHGVKLGNNEKKLFKANHRFYYNDILSDKAYNNLVRLWQVLSAKYTNKNELNKVFIAFANTFLATECKKFLGRYDFMVLCINFHIKDYIVSLDLCQCKQNGALAFFAIGNYTGVANEF